ncbi:hypothetical protein ACFVY0_44840 [Streptomyces sp. NPDC058286]|uniref:hypothetical protein n=1 Tax=Streptomyces sp. NPDC058286 TaxID=3346422 RepID=UPI0036EC9970
MVTAHPPLAMTAAVVTVVVLATRWWATPHERFSHRIRSLVQRHPQDLDASAEVLREAEQLVSRQWDRLQPLYPDQPEDPRSRSR